MPWHAAVSIVRPYMVKVCTPRGHGSGFLFAYASGGELAAVATAAHVVSQAAEWEEHIRLEHPSSGQSLFLKANERAIVMRQPRDTAAIIFSAPDTLFPKEPLTLLGERSALKVATKIGWLGFPSVAPENLCFFSGSISSKIETDRSYLVDGVAINGVSGGPAFFIDESPQSSSIYLIGLVSAYRPNWVATGVSLPGLSIIRHVDALHDVVRGLRDLSQAKEEQEKSVEPTPRPEPPLTPRESVSPPDPLPNEPQ